MNSCDFTGRLTKDIELGTLNNEKKTVNTIYTVAVADKFKKDKANFPSFQSFGATAEYLKKYGKKGMYIEIENAKATTYKDKKDNTVTLFSANDVKLIFSNSKDKEDKPKEKENKSKDNNEEDGKPF